MAKNKRLLVFLSGLAVVLSLSLLAGGRVPLYDGIGFPDEPYRYVNPPDASKITDRPPKTAEATDNITNQTNPNEFSLISFEQGPQVSVFILKNSIHAPPEATQLEAKAIPGAPGSNLPKIGPVVGNIYSFSITTDKGQADLSNASQKQSSQIQLRLPQGYPVGAVMVFRVDNTHQWRQIKTERVGNDIYESPIVGFGDYGLVSKPGITKSNSQTATKKSNGSTVLFIGLGLLIGLVAVILAVRFRIKNGK